MTSQLRATYRIQLHKDFTLLHAAELVPYLARLGIDCLHTSPTLKASAGSQSGYDVVDPSVINPELGGQEAHEALTQALHNHHMVRMVDLVPNHMAIAGGDNPWWDDVLRHGRSSHHASWFDVDWEADGETPSQILLPALHDQFGRVLEAGEFSVVRTGGSFRLNYRDHSYPLEPRSIAPLLAKVAERLTHSLLGYLADGFRDLPRPAASLQTQVARRHRDHQILSQMLARCCQEDSGVAAAIEEELTRLNASFAELGRLLDAQNFRLAHWEAADQDLGYRRFFDVTTLAGVRVELPEVFSALHKLPLQWLREGSVQALRIDHPDGLRDPGQYLRRLRCEAPAATIVVEKILQPGEVLPPSWPVEGSTGYDFCNRVQALFLDPTGEDLLDQCYREFTGREASLAEEILSAKREVLDTLLGSEVNRLTSLLREICQRHWRHRDHTRHSLATLLVHVIAHLPVYRTYVSSDGEVSQADRERIAQAIAATATACPDIDAELLDFLGQLLRMELEGALEAEFAQRFQQLSGPAMAKGVEDTVFYRYVRLVALNEVGGDPGQGACTPHGFHRQCLAAPPTSMLATSTHDTKRSEDVRARLLVLSEVAPLWRDTCRQWRAMSSQWRKEWDDPTMEYLYYQSVVGAWPISLPRMLAYMEKAARENKEHTSWTHVDEHYESGLRAFVDATLASDDFVAQVEALVSQLQAAGRSNSLAETLIKLTAPGIADVYQGCELWDHSLVDPDNRRPVDYRLRAALLDELPTLSPAQIVARMDEGLPKLWVLQTALQQRAATPKVFDPTSPYTGLSAIGPMADHVLIFMRGDAAITLVPRLVMKLEAGGGWQDTELRLPEGEWCNVMMPGETWRGSCFMRDVFAVMPVALLVRAQ